ncbi:MAG: 30S ribosomal protein S17 [Candidatus Woesearchaeota archaeon]
MALNTITKLVVPEKACQNDKKCPFHGEIKLRGRTQFGKIIRCTLGRTAVVEWVFPRYVSKYERFEKKRTRVMAHNPSCIGAKEGDYVKIMESRKLSKCKNFVIVQVIQQSQVV